MPEAPGRYALFVPSLRGGGAERVMLSIAKGLAARGQAVDLVLVRAEGPYLSDVPRAVRVVDLGAARALGALWPLSRYLRRECPQALLSTLEHTNLVALWARRLAGTPTRVVIREANTQWQRSQAGRPVTAGLLRYAMRRCYAWADGVVAVSQGVADDLARSVGLPCRSIHVIYNPIDIDDVRTRLREPLVHPWFAAGEPPVILGVGRLTAQKDFATLMRAFAEVRRQREARLLILGEGEARKELVGLVEVLGLGRQVLLPGFVQNPFAYMARAAVFVLSSAWEGLPNVLIQALACGCPIVSTDCPSGPAEILDGGQYGRLVSPRDPHAMAEAILGALQGSGGEDVAAQVARFAAPEVVEQYLQLLRSDAPARGTRYRVEKP